MSDRPYPNDRKLELFCSAPSAGWDYWRFIVVYPDYEWVDGALSSFDVSEPLGDCLTPPVLPQPCYWEGP
ncbi:MAG TPA: hypothetical protein VFO09_05495 [Methyloceanibacter sp.]|nr:hypothetical protein [Methyloceanibacter sp.]